MSELKAIQFRGKFITTDEARAMIAELTDSLSKVDPVLTDSPAGLPVPTLIDPRWYSEPSNASTGTMLCFRDPGAGWKGFILPWAEVSNLIGLLSRQMSAVIEGDASSRVSIKH